MPRLRRAGVRGGREGHNAKERGSRAGIADLPLRGGQERGETRWNVPRKERSAGPLGWGRRAAIWDLSRCFTRFVSIHRGNLSIGAKRGEKSGQEVPPRKLRQDCRDRGEKRPILGKDRTGMAKIESVPTCVAAEEGGKWVHLGEKETLYPFFTSVWMGGVDGANSLTNIDEAARLVR